MSCCWIPEEISITSDANDYKTLLTEGDKKIVKYILAFFASSDAIVNINLVERFKKDVPILEAGYFYDFQIAMENVHAEMYSILLDSIIPNKKEKDNLLMAIQTLPVIEKMSKFMFECINSDATFAERLLRMACVEGIFFTGCFCAIYWLSNRGLMKGLTHSNELIARDEALHTDFALFLYNEISPEFKLTHENIYKIFNEAVELAEEFINEALPIGLPEMNANLMTLYIKSQADNVLSVIEIPPLFGVKHKFQFMEQINLTNKTNFFEKRVSEYSKVQVADHDSNDISNDF
jgi:ribonucleotide reductase beta subunit family protein with ferritin-like domain